MPPISVTIISPVQVSDTNPVLASAAPMGEADKAGLELVADGDLDGTWKIFASCRPAPGVELADITDGFNPAVAAVDHTDAKTQRQFVAISQLVALWVKAVFTPTSGSGMVSCYARIG